MRGLAATVIVIAATTYTALLCALHTNVAHVSNDVVVAVDAAITLAALGLALTGASASAWLFLFLLATNAVWLLTLSPNVDAKAIVRDPLVPIAFTLLGAVCGSFQRARAIFLGISVLVLGVAIFELVAPDLFTRVFNVLSFYQSRGVITAQAAQYDDTSLFLSGMRPGGRVLLAFLGQHRVSSIFLEPVSMGNFGAIAVAFALAIPARYWRSGIAIGLIGFTCIVLADARFALTASVLFVAARFVPLRWMNTALVAMPVIAIAIILYAARSFSTAGDDLPSRLATSGQILEFLNSAQLFGAAPNTISTVDAGYAYIFTSLGLPCCVLLWSVFVMLRTPTPHAQRYKFFLGIFACTLLCVSGTSLFALKTAALAWFVLGAMVREVRPARVVVRQPALSVPMAAGR